MTFWGAESRMNCEKNRWNINHFWLYYRESRFLGSAVHTADAMIICKCLKSPLTNTTWQPTGNQIVNGCNIIYSYNLYNCPIVTYSILTVITYIKLEGQCGFRRLPKLWTISDAVINLDHEEWIASNTCDVQIRENRGMLDLLKALADIDYLAW